MIWKAVALAGLGLGAVAVWVAIANGYGVGDVQRALYRHEDVDHGMFV